MKPLAIGVEKLDSIYFLSGIACVGLVGIKEEEGFWIISELNDVQTVILSSMPGLIHRLNQDLWWNVMEYFAGLTDLCNAGSSCKIMSIILLKQGCLESLLKRNQTRKFEMFGLNHEIFERKFLMIHNCTVAGSFLLGCICGFAIECSAVNTGWETDDVDIYFESGSGNLVELFRQYCDSENISLWHEYYQVSMDTKKSVMFKFWSIALFNLTGRLRWRSWVDTLERLAVGFTCSAGSHLSYVVDMPCISIAWLYSDFEISSHQRINLDSPDIIAHLSKILQALIWSFAVICLHITDSYWGGAHFWVTEEQLSRLLKREGSSRLHISNSLPRRALSRRNRSMSEPTPQSSICWLTFLFP